MITNLVKHPAAPSNQSKTTAAAINMGRADRSYLRMESGPFVLCESGDKILLTGDRQITNQPKSV